MLPSDKPSKLFAIKEEIYKEEGFWDSQEEVNDALDAHANKKIFTLADELYGLMLLHEQSTHMDEMADIWQRMHDMISVMLLKLVHGENE